MASIEFSAKLNSKSQATEAVACAHCQAIVPLGLVAEGDLPSFCCNGCQMAWQLIHSNGLDAYYNMSRTGSTPLGSQRDTGPYADFDLPEFQEKFAKPLPGGRWSISLALQGINCVACVWLIEKLPQLVPGVIAATVNWTTATVQVEWLPERVALSQIAKTLSQLGYAAHPLRQGEQTQRAIAENRRHLVRLGVAGAAAGNNMLIGLALYLGWFAGMDSAVETLMRYASCLVGMVSMLWPGAVFFRSAWSAIITRTPHMDLPIALGLGVGSLSGLWNTVVGAGEIYFDSLSVLVFLLLVGRYIQFRQQQRSADAVDMLYRLTPRHARKWINGQIVETHADLLQQGDTVEVLAGELIPVDGTILAGESLVDEALLTGESQPVSKQIGETVAAGTLNVHASLRIHATAIGRETRIGQIVQLVERSAAEKPEIVEWANRIGAWFVVIVMVLALGTVALWAHHGWTHAINQAVALLIVACPCALALATPLAISVALGRAADRKILIKGGDVLQRLQRPHLIWLDKTGTLTQGKIECHDWYGDTRYRVLVAAIERNSAHPVAVALSRLTKEQDLSLPSPKLVLNVKQSPLGGIAGDVDGVPVAIGNESFIREEVRTEIGDEYLDFAQQLVAKAHSPVFVAVDRNVVAVAGVGDALRADALSAVQRLQQQGWQVGILSGDHPKVVANVAKQLGISPELVRGGVMPEEKVAVLKASKDAVMVGDGVNDSAALAFASVGIAVHGGSETSLQAAPVYLGRPGLQPILELLEGSRRTLSTIRWSFVASLTYNIIAVCLAMAGGINPLVAAALMPISSLTVVLMSIAPGNFSVRTSDSFPSPN